MQGVEENARIGQRVLLLHPGQGAESVADEVEARRAIGALEDRVDPHGYPANKIVITGVTFPQRVLGSPILAHVLEDRVHRADVAARGRTQWDGVDLDPNMLPAGGVEDPHQNAVCRFAGGQRNHAGMRVSGKRGSIFMDRLPAGSARVQGTQFVDARAQYRGGGRVRVDDGPAPILINDAMGGGLEEEAVLLFAALQGAFRIDARGDVLDHANVSRTLADIDSEWSDRHVDPDHRTIRAQVAFVHPELGDLACIQARHLRQVGLHVIGMGDLHPVEGGE